MQNIAQEVRFNVCLQSDFCSMNCQGELKKKISGEERGCFLNIKYLKWIDKSTSYQEFFISLHDSQTLNM